MVLLVLEVEKCCTYPDMRLIRDGLVSAGTGEMLYLHEASFDQSFDTHNEWNYKNECH